MHETHGHEAAVRALVAGGLRARHAFVLRAGDGIVDGLVRVGAVHRPHASGRHRGLHGLTGRRAEGVLVHPADSAVAACGAVARPGTGSGSDAAVSRERSGHRSAQGRCGDYGRQSGFAPFLVCGTQCPVSFQRFLPADSFPAYAVRERRMAETRFPSIQSVPRARASMRGNIDSGRMPYGRKRPRPKMDGACEGQGENESSDRAETTGRTRRINGYSAFPVVVDVVRGRRRGRARV